MIFSTCCKDVLPLLHDSKVYVLERTFTKMFAMVKTKSFREMNAKELDRLPIERNWSSFVIILLKKKFNKLWFGKEQFINISDPTEMHVEKRI